jgi:hypothetical protein
MDMINGLFAQRLPRSISFCAPKANSGQMKAESFLPLPLFVFGIDADHPHHPFAADDLALGADAFH